MHRFLFELQYLLHITPWDTGISPPELLEFLDASPPGRALDLGCGTGTNAITMAHHGWDVTAIDHSTRAIQIAKGKIKSEGLHIDFRRGDVTRLDEIVEPFDLILDIGCYHGLSSSAKARYLENLTRLLKPEGTFLLYTWLDTKANTGMLPSEKFIRDQFETCCEILEVSRGTDQKGTRASAWFTMRRPT